MMIVMIAIGALMILLGLYHIKQLPSGKGTAVKTESAKETFDRLVEVLKNFFTKKHIVYYIFFIILYRFGEGFVMKIVPLFLKAARSEGGWDSMKNKIGLYYGHLWSRSLCAWIGSLRAIISRISDSNAPYSHCVAFSTSHCCLHLPISSAARKRLVNWKYDYT